MPTRILAVNDDRDILRMLADVLELSGYEVATHTVFERAVMEATTFKPDLLLLDWMFGREELGLEALQTLKRNPATATAPVIVCSAASRRMQELEGALQAQGVTIVHKPFERDDLLAVITTNVGSEAAAP